MLKNNNKEKPNMQTNKRKQLQLVFVCYKYLHLSVSTRSVIGQFCGLYFIVQPTSFHFLCARLTSEIITVNILLTSFSRSIL